MKKSSKKYKDWFISTLLNTELSCMDTWAFTLLFHYYSDLELLNDGNVTLSDLGYKEKRKVNETISIRRITDLAFLTSSTLSNMEDDESFNEIVDKHAEGGLIAEVNIDGFLRSSGGLSHTGVKQKSEQIYNLYNKSNLQGLFVNVDSGGGESKAGHIYYSTFSDLPVKAVSFGHLIGSAAYHAVLPLNKIFATRNAYVGSTGSMVQLDKESLDKFKNRFLEFYSKHAPNKNMSTQKLRKGDFSGILKEVDDSTLRFHENIRRHRNKVKDYALQGEVFAGDKLLDTGFVDGITTKFGAYKELVKLIKNKPTQHAVGFSENNIIHSSNLITMPKQSVWTNLIASLNSKFNLNLSEESTQEEVESAVNGGIDKSIQDQVSNQMSTLNDTIERKLNSLDSTVSELVSTQQKNFNGLKSQNETIANVLSKTVTNLEDISKSVGGVSTIVAKMKGLGSEDTSGEGGASNDSFNETQSNLDKLNEQLDNLGGQSQPEGDSEY